MFARLMGLKTISPDRLHQLVQSLEPVTIIDVNSRRSWMEARVPGASNLDPAAYKESDLPPDKNAVLVFYCLTRCAEKPPMRLVEPRRWATTMFMSCQRESAAGSLRSCPQNLEGELAPNYS